MPAEPPRVHIAIGSRFENIELVQVVVSDLLERHGAVEEERHWIDLAIREAVANAIKHGNREDPGKQVEVEATIEGEELTVRVWDRGAGFDPERVADPLEPENLLNPFGRGIFYMRRFMDRIDFRPRAGGGTELVLSKRLEASDPVSDEPSP